MTTATGRWETFRRPIPRQASPASGGLPPRDDRDWLTGPEVCWEARITYRQLDYWTRTGRLFTVGDDAPGSGYARRYAVAEARVAAATATLGRAGLPLRDAARLARSCAPPGVPSPDVRVRLTPGVCLLFDRGVLYRLASDPPTEDDPT